MNQKMNMPYSTATFSLKIIAQKYEQQKDAHKAALAYSVADMRSLSALVRLAALNTYNAYNDGFGICICEK